MATPLRELDGHPHAPATLADSTVILVDYQNTYTQGVMELEGWSAALDAAERLLERARREGAKVIHVQHDGGEGSPYDIRAEIGRIHPRVAPLDGEPVVVKTAPNGFVGTDLGDRVDAAGNQDVVVVGFMTHMCVTFTSEGAFLRGNRVTVVADACATRALPSAAGAVSAADLHRGALATIGDVYAQVVPDADALR
ncbi:MULTISPECIES: cysteine hydrolase family protein [unclassified Microbacterium]|uniref:cysteine hydrolase family protein n=1 Tax=unclassified Microbacterium TaxID=2609290 RepID=UPI0012FBB8EA|nr:cysteine hydrolase family protein [Microbacterium sp. MAH-37]MVQ43095.1 isochorismatase family protein [Microbacterium sp. MAH-37]